jgi:hypothetical protein
MSSAAEVCWALLSGCLQIMHTERF